MLFSEPVEIITCWSPKEIIEAFAAIDAALDQGFHVAGGFCYELGYHLEPFLSDIAPDFSGPLFQVGVYGVPNRALPDEGGIQESSFSRHSAIHASLDGEAYGMCVKTIKEYILAGDIYQANFTFPLRFAQDANVWSLYQSVLPHQNVPFGAVIDLPDLEAASFSPELFFRKIGNRVEARPMKGTAPRGESWEEDEANKTFLQSDAKNRAENLMIVDLIRNDLGRLAELGTVSVDNGFHVETYETLHQMTSTVSASIKPDTETLDIFRALFPCGSVTGAPKIRAMEVIAEQEIDPRGLYCGAIGYITPERDMCFSVPIRTVSLDGFGGATLNVGSGVVADSAIEDEYQECLLKARFLTRALARGINSENPSVGLIETMRAVDGNVPLLQAHLTRLNRSAIALGLDVDVRKVKAALLSGISDSTGEIRLRLQLEPDGSMSITSSPLASLPPDPVVIPAEQKLDSGDPLRRHKSTQRDIYDEERKRLVEVDGAIDVIFFNEKGHLCEGAITNVFVEVDGTMMTPPLSSGVLPGVMRAKLIDEWNVVEKETTRDDLLRASRVIVSNAVRGPVAVRLAGFDG